MFTDVWKIRFKSCLHKKNKFLLQITRDLHCMLWWLFQRLWGRGYINTLFLFCSDVILRMLLLLWYGLRTCFNLLQNVRVRACVLRQSSFSTLCLILLSQLPASDMWTKYDWLLLWMVNVPVVVRSVQSSRSFMNYSPTASRGVFVYSGISWRRTV